jgi:hypothetical protein
LSAVDIAKNIDKRPSGPRKPRRDETVGRVFAGAVGKNYEQMKLEHQNELSALSNDLRARESLRRKIYMDAKILTLKNLSPEDTVILEAKFAEELELWGTDKSAWVNYLARSKKNPKKSEIELEKLDDKPSAIPGISLRELQRYECVCSYSAVNVARHINQIPILNDGVAEHNYRKCRFITVGFVAGRLPNGKLTCRRYVYGK